MAKSYLQKKMKEFFEKKKEEKMIKEAQEVNRKIIESKKEAKEQFMQTLLNKIEAKNLEREKGE